MIDFQIKHFNSATKDPATIIPLRSEFIHDYNTGKVVIGDGSSSFATLRNINSEGSTTFIALTDTPVSYGIPGQAVVMNGTGDALEFATVASSYELPTASADTLGGVKVGSRLTITDGVLSADEQGGGLAKVSSNDTTAGYLNGKLVAGANITLTEGSDGENEILTIATTGGSSIGWTAETAFTATPASTSTLTMTADKTGSIKVGMALKYTISSVVYYGIVTAITSNLLTIAGAPMGGDVTALYYSTNPAQVVQVDFFIAGAFADAANTGLLASDMNTKFDWNLQEARLVQIRHTVKVDDSGANQPRVNLSVDGSVVSTSNSNAGVTVAETWSSTVVDINTTNYVVARDAAIEIVTDANGSNDDASDLTVSGVFVII